MNVYENQLLGFFLERLGERRLQLVALLGDERCEALRQVLALTLMEEAGKGSYFELEQTERPAPAGFRSIVWRGEGNAGSRLLLAFNFKEAFEASALPLFGLVAATFGGPLGLAALPSAGELLRVLWSKMSMLKKPEHADAIALLDALAQAKTDAILAGSPFAPTWDELVGRTDMSADRAVIALKLLRDKGIIEIENWGNQAETLDHLANRWKVKV